MGCVFICRFCELCEERFGHHCISEFLKWILNFLYFSEPVTNSDLKIDLSPDHRIQDRPFLICFAMAIVPATEVKFVCLFFFKCCLQFTKLILLISKGLQLGLKNTKFYLSFSILKILHLFPQRILCS